jgi:chromosome segregation ATPase
VLLLGTKENNVQKETIFRFVFIVIACVVCFGAGWFGHGFVTITQSVFGPRTDVSDIERRDKEFARLFDEYRTREREFDKQLANTTTQLQLAVADRERIANQLATARTEARVLVVTIEELGKSYSELATRFANLKQSVDDSQQFIDGIVSGTRRIDDSTKRALEVLRIVQKRSDENHTTPTE